MVFLALFYALNFILDKYFGFELDGKYGKIETLVRKNTTEKLQNLVPEQEIESLDQNDGQVCQNELRPEKVPFRFKPPFWFYTQEPWQAQEEENCALNVAQEHGQNSDAQASLTAIDTSITSFI